MSISIHCFDGYDPVQYQLSFSNIPKQIGEHQIVASLSGSSMQIGSSFSTSFSDVSGDIFRYDTSLQYSFLEISFLDKMLGHIQAEFSVQLARVNMTVYSPELPDTLNIVGDFFTKIDY